MNSSNPKTEVVYILVGTSPEYTSVRQHLKLTPPQAFWLTGPARLKGLNRPKVYRAGKWRTLPRLAAIEAALAEVEAEIIDLPL